MLPTEIPELNIPFFLTRFTVVHGVFLYEALFIFYFLIRIFSYFSLSSANFHPPQEVKSCAALIFLLGCATILSNAINIAFGYAQPLSKIGEGFRLFVIAAFIVCTYEWSTLFGARILFKWYLLGLYFSGAAHIYYSRELAFRELGNLPSLLGQNGPGPGFALGLLLCSLLIYFHKYKSDIILAIACIPVCLYGVAVSYSKTTMLIGMFGLISIIVAFFSKISGTRKLPSNFLIFAIICCIFFFNYPQLAEFAADAKIYFDFKFAEGAALDNESTQERLHYLFTTFKILIENPLIGVGSGGFYEAVRHVDPEALKYEDDINDGSANPHNSFLYYTASSGFIGLCLALIIFLYFNFILYRATRLSALRLGILPLMTLSFIVYGAALPSLFNTFFFYVFFIASYSTLRDVKTSYKNSRDNDSRNQTSNSSDSFA